jgi:hypothetical protein
LDPTIAQQLRRPVQAPASDGADAGPYINTKAPLRIDDVHDRRALRRAQAPAHPGDFIGGSALGVSERVHTKPLRVDLPAPSPTPTAHAHRPGRRGGCRGR